MTLARKSVLITGCSADGIDAALVEFFQEKGYHVFATLRVPAKLPTALSKAENVTVLTLDALCSGETGGRLDILVNNSGGNLVAPSLDVEIEQGKRLFELNF
jgi:1-acylglycerone phosphate reductase